MTLQSDLCATLVDEWHRGGMRRAVIAPGSRSSLLALALLADGRVEVRVRLDERSAAYFALGIALGTGEPVALVTTSGTASVEVHAAVAEADLSRVPLLVCSADRPAELHRVGAPQTIEQSHVFGEKVRFALDLGVAEEATRPYWRSFASRLLAEATASVAGPGPVHLNLALREPFSPERGVAAPGRAGGEEWHAVERARAPSPELLARVVAALSGARRGLVVAGGPPGSGEHEAVLDLAAALSWPVLAEPRAMPRSPHPLVVAHSDAILRSPAAAGALVPDCVLELGAPHASKVLSQFLARCGEEGVPRLLVDPYGAFADPERQASLVIGADPGLLCRAAAGALGGHARSDGGFLSAWRRADDAASEAIDAFLDQRDELDEPFVARELFGALPVDAALFASSSMPVRDLEWFAAARPDPPLVFANRGANGIDGIVSSVLGLAVGLGPRRRVVGLVGDLAFLHDLSGLVTGTNEPAIDVTLVVVDNGGGGIFSFLDYAPGLEEATFERAFGTPQAPDCAEVARALGARVVAVDAKAELAPALHAAVARPGVDVLVVRTVRGDNVAVHAALAASAARAVETALA